MIERDDLIRKLEEAGTLDAIRWAYRSAARQVAEEYSEESGHDAGWVGQTRYTLLRDRLNRVFSCGRYALAADALPAEGRDVVTATLPQSEIDTMPVLEADMVSRSNLNQSIGWSFDGMRWLLASGPYGKLDSIRWDRKSQTKKRVAQQGNFNPDQASLFEELHSDEDAGLLDAMTLPNVEDLDQLTLVLAHSQDPVTWQGELRIGMPRLSHGDGSAWSWSQDLLTAPPVKGGSRQVAPAGPSNDDHVNEPDAPVKLRANKSARQPLTAEER
ncbi:hypothetical protein [Arthrobacter sp. PsM3]|uniref:hypothetical protein n=1 Tax=Arthrobacter sp. PsM3 TaxID=3030531 RepID=UPI00263A52F3|nr:hypothetical protein [Arthrobacter sp. PsM3]MDN4643426.1 hypothetical protein [Arthrobacter sp. PsM3]